MVASSSDRTSQHEGRKTLSIIQACQHVGVSRRTIYNWLNAGKLEYIRTAGGSVRIYSDSLWRRPAEDQVVEVGQQGVPAA